MASAIMEGIAALAEVSATEVTVYATGSFLTLMAATGAVLGVRRAFARWGKHFVRHGPAPAKTQLLDAEQGTVDEEAGVPEAQPVVAAANGDMVDVSLTEPSAPVSAPLPASDMSPNKQGKQPMREAGAQ